MKRFCYIDEQHRPFRLGYLAFTEPKLQQELLRVMRLYKREYRLKLHSKEDYKNKRTRGASIRLAQYLEAFVSSYSGVTFGIIQTSQPYVVLLNLLSVHHFDWRIESDETTLRKEELVKFRLTLDKLRFEFQAIPKILQSPLIGAVDYLLYFGIKK